MNQTARDKLDKQLLELAMVALVGQPLTHGRRVALSRLINAIFLSGKLCRPQSGKFTFNFYEDIYHEALQELLLYICQYFDKYDAKRASIMAWVNFLLERRFFSEAVAKVLGRREITEVTIQDNLVVPEKPEDLTEIIKEYIALDPENLWFFRHFYGGY
ncbi:DNA-directed RNA polymerase specialized sigma subunit, sigma24 family (plasmid) [Nostoc flagelliforme CCNUN1]|uniref:DNA-directed RNA polymerase specialized sigma subunit, sigma24 family n=1 Tax=Nostoc flagelliforme CCNUN1 TaxID=2038116 RepID=A0A2K8T6H6_9NOSO|nr:hypothetical protein [Nostoc flagelliforme]AUB43306.1 DNA-directed RNA polymerase specialized sigma subunit, sigma24 family [Nostoc flagelliforme CCNUN1]